MPLFDPRRNSFGLLRLLLATAVIVSHAWPLGGFGADPGLAYNNLGILAVECFFALSGFLIASSGSRLEAGRFLWHRIVRIFPALWVVLLFVAVLAAPIVWRAGGDRLSQYPFADPSPLAYLLQNVLLQNAQQTIGATLTSNPYPSLWNGPLYTLPFEFLCYLMIAGLIAFRALGPRSTALLALSAWVWLQIQDLGLIGSVDTRQARFTLAFFVGAVVYFHRDALLRTDRWWIPASAAIVCAVTYVTWGFFQIGIIALAYLLIWVGTVLPFSRIAVRRDYSYGMYIYGWPVAQLASFFGANQFGLFVYLLIVLAVTYGLAAASWHGIESRALRLKGASLPEWFRGVRDTSTVVRSSH